MENIEKEKVKTIACELNPPNTYSTSPLIHQNAGLPMVRNESEP